MWEPHETKDTSLKVAAIDVDMVDGILWMNSFPSIYTAYCCQGDDDKKIRPYITFYCWDHTTLVRILDSVGLVVGPSRHLGSVQIDIYQGMMRYLLEFSSKEDMIRWTKKVKKQD